MSLVVNHNMMAANVANNLNTHYSRLSTSTQRLSTGMRINSAADDAAGLAIRELQRADIAAFHQGARNANDAISLIQVADGALSIIDEKLIRMKELAEQAATGTYDSTQRMMIESEYQQMASEITRIAIATDFNGIHLLDGSLSGDHDGSGVTVTGKMKIHFGTGNDSAEDYYYIEIGSATAEALGLGNQAYIDGVETITTTETKTKEVELTSEYYEKLRDTAAQEAYNNTYNSKFPQYYTDKIKELGTPITSAKKAEASTYAESLAKKEANNDKATIQNNIDKIYNDTYANTYTTAYAKYIADGSSASEEESAADADAIKAAIQSIIDASNTVVKDNDVSELSSLNALPAKTEGNATTLLDNAREIAYNNAYDMIYDALYAEAANNAVSQNINGISSTLTDDQISEIKTSVSAEAASKAGDIADTVRADLESIYNTAYQTNLASGEDAAREAAWDAVANAMKSGSAFGSTGISANDFVTESMVDVSTTHPVSSDFSSLKQNVVDAVYNSVFESTVNKILAAADAQLRVNENLVPSNLDPTSAQITAIRNEITKNGGDAQRIAQNVSEQIGRALQAVYDQAYSTASTSEPYFNYYNYYINNISSNQNAAHTYALDKVQKIDAWNAVVAVLEPASLTGQSFGFGTTTVDESKDGAIKRGAPLDTETFDYKDITVSGLSDWNGNGSYSITISGDSGKTTDVQNAYISAGSTGLAYLASEPHASSPATIPVFYEITTSEAATFPKALYTSIGTDSTTFIDTNHAINGGDSTVIAACKAIADKYTSDSTETITTTKTVETQGTVLRDGATISTQEAAQKAIVAINEAIISKDKIRANLGATQNRLENTIANLNIQAENLQAAESRISDVDVATEMTEFVRQQILTQSAVAMLSQANSMPQMAMQIIGG